MSSLNDSLSKIIELLHKTGDRCIILDRDKSAFVIMSLKDYEKLILNKSQIQGLTEEELLDKINREIAVWKSEQDEETLKHFDLYSGLDLEPRIEKIKREDDYFVELE